MSDSNRPFVSVYVPEYHSQHGSRIKARAKSLRRWWNRLSRLQKSFLFLLVMILMVFTVILGTLSWIPQLNTEPESSPYKSKYNLNSVNLKLPRDGDPPQFESNSVLHGLAKSDNEINQNQVHRALDRPVYRPASPQVEENIAAPPGENPWEGLPLQKDSDPESNIQPVPAKDLLPDSGDGNAIEQSGTKTTTTVGALRGLKNRIGEQAKENIRSVISLDPVIPLKPKHAVSVSTSPKLPNALMVQPSTSSLKLDGPKNERQKAVVDAFLHAWNGYKTYAWGKDHLRPISGVGQDWFGLGLTIVDSLDTIYIMGLQREFFEARDWVEESLSFDVGKNVNLFETTIRVLGGLLGAYHLSGEQVFLNKADELGSILLVGFNTRSGVPFSDVNLRARTAQGPSWNPDSTTSEVSTLQLEFRDLSRATTKVVYEQTAMKVSEIIHNQKKTHGLVPIHIQPSTGKFRHSSPITLGARGDSYYEYLLKQWIQTGKKIDFFRDDYLEAVEGMRDKLLRRTPLSNLTYLGELLQNGNSFSPKMDHLVCYLPGTLALGYSHGLPLWHLDLAKDLIHTCYLTYKLQPTGLAPEITHFRTDDDMSSDFYVKSNDAHNLLRPETVESLWYLSQITGDKKYQDWGWEIFQSFMKYTRVEYGFTSIGTVLDSSNVRQRDMMESFFLAETLKYFYLLFSDRPIFDLNTWIFNTEAHPLPVYDH